MTRSAPSRAIHGASAGASCRRHRRGNDRGFVLPVTALVLVPLLIISALAVDLGGWYSEASKIQRSADAAALAGVVWMPDIGTARTVARQTAARNGYVHGSGGVTVDVSSPGDQRLTVTITAPGELYLGRLVTDSITLRRTATAEYILPVPLGSPRNYFGTGDLLSSSLTVGGLKARENLWLAINPWCTDKVDGDRYQSQYDGNRPYSSSSCPSNPSTSSKANPEYREEGYELYIELPASRPSDTVIRLYDARYDPSSSSSPDMALYSGDQDYTFTLYNADNTPLDDSDNVARPGCSRTFTRNTSFDGGTYLGANRWNELCRIPRNAPAGRYILRMTNEPGRRSGAGTNNFSVVAAYSSAGTGTGSLCDGRSDSTCPRVFGKDAISVYADESSATANFFLSEIGADHAGKQMRITLYDPGEGGNLIRIRRPTGANTWVNQTFSYTSSSGHSGTNVTSLDVTGSRFNGHTVTIYFMLASNYAPPSNNAWWQIQYEFTNSEVTDRTTWSAEILGDPVHLVE